MPTHCCPTTNIHSLSPMQLPNTSPYMSSPCRIAVANQPHVHLLPADFRLLQADIYPHFVQLLAALLLPNTPPTPFALPLPTVMLFPRPVSHCC